MRDWSIVEWPETELIRATSPLLIIGASVRAAAQSARRAGWQQLILLDQFQDRDLPPGCRGRQLKSLNLRPDLQSGIEEARAWMYTGAMENRPEVVARISRYVPLMGCPRETLLRVRHPRQLAEAVRDAGLPWAEVRMRPGAGLQPETWLCKPRKSAAGHGIRFVDNPQKEIADRAVYYQRYIRGAPCSGTFLAAAGTARLLGVTQQLIGDRRFGAGDFQYAGSIGPVSLSIQQREHWQQLGQTLSRAFGLQGLFGVDALDTGNKIVPVEVNPRYTASMELLERSWRWPIVGWHMHACHDGWLPATPLPEPTSYCGKAIVFALRTCQWTPQCDRLIDRFSEPDAWSAVADIPRIGTWVSPGTPLLTVLAQGSTLQDVSERLAERVDQIWSVTQ